MKEDSLCPTENKNDFCQQKFERFNDIQLINKQQGYDILSSELANKIEQRSRDESYKSFSSFAEMMISAILPIIIEEDIQKYVKSLKKLYPHIDSVIWIIAKYVFAILLFVLTYFVVKVFCAVIKKITSNRDLKKREKDRLELINILKNKVIDPLLMGLICKDEAEKLSQYKEIKLYQSIGYYSSAMWYIDKFNLIENPTAKRKNNKMFLEYVDVAYLRCLLNHVLSSLRKIKEDGFKDHRIDILCHQIQTKIEYLDEYFQQC